jgi:integrase
MTPAVHKLTPEKILQLPPGRHGDGGGLCVQKLPGGTMSWLFRWERAGKAHGMGLGPVDPARLAESLAEARQQAVVARAALAAGRNPLEDKRAVAAAAAPPATRKTFADVATEYLARHQDSWRSPVHARQWRQVLDDYVLPKIGTVPIADLSSADVRKVLAPLWRSRPEVARKTIGKIGLIVKLAIANDWRTAANPSTLPVMCTVLGRLPKKPVHHASMPYGDVPAFYTKLAERTEVASLAIRFLILTATRSSETRFATWREIDERAALWRIPASRMKGGEEHRVPLSPAALAVLKACKRINGVDWVFPGRDGAISDTACRNVLRDLQLSKSEATLHGFRSSARTWMAETGVDHDIAEACLAHTVRDDVVRAYQRSKFDAARRQVMTRWAQWVTSDPAYYG